MRQSCPCATPENDVREMLYLRHNEFSREVKFSVDADIQKSASVFTSVALQRVPSAFHHLSCAVREIFQFAIGFL
jgi:hypothetical protein